MNLLVGVAVTLTVFWLDLWDRILVGVVDAVAPAAFADVPR